MKTFCCDDFRRNAVRLHPVLNGIDFLEVSDTPSLPSLESQTHLLLRFLKPLAPGILTPSSFIVEGGERIRNIKVLEISTVAEDPAFLRVRVSVAGDFSRYTLRLVSDPSGDSPPEGFDPLLSSVGFSFKAACASDFDCKSSVRCEKPDDPSPDIDYLVKDYPGFRRLMLDRMATLVPGWKERNPADLGIALVELLAYAGDYLSYRQDAVATEAFLDTSRRRISVRRHARLVDYFLHDGCNSRVWVRISCSPGTDGVELKKGEGPATTKIISRQKGLPVAFRTDSGEFEKAVNGGAPIFELMHDIRLFAAHNEMKFYTWGKKGCCLPRGSTSAALAGHFPNLRPGDILIFKETKGAVTGIAGDANPEHCHALRLTGVHLTEDLLFDIDGRIAQSPPQKPPMPVTEIKWHPEDALPFSLCISTAGGLQDVSVALGNVVLADYGRTVADDPEYSLLPSVVPDSTLAYPRGDETAGSSMCTDRAREFLPPRYNPRLTGGPLTHAAPCRSDSPASSASSMMKWEMREVMPALHLSGLMKEETHQWHPRRDLLNSDPLAREFVVETETDGTAFLRFGNDVQGERPASGTSFTAVCRIGNGSRGNVGAGALAHLATDDAAVIACLSDEGYVGNPLPARGGTDPETMEEVKLRAPEAFKIQQRTILPEDFELLSRKGIPDIQHVTTALRWTGSWKTFFLTADRVDGAGADPEFEAGLRDKLEQYRIAGVDLEVDSPVQVPLFLEMEICVSPGFFAADVKAALLELFSSRKLSGERKGIFHPDNFSFGEPLFLSRLYQAAQLVQGVDSVRITRFSRQGDPGDDAMNTGILKMGRKEIARLDNDPNFPDHGGLNLKMKGGR